MDCLCGWDEESAPVGPREALAEVALVVVDEEGGVEVADLRRRLPPHHQRARLRPVDSSSLGPIALHGEQAVQEDAPGEGPAHPRGAPGPGAGVAFGIEELRARRAGAW